jgi:hypothetical protein
MENKEKANLLIYRVREKGLEVLLMEGQNEWSLPQGAQNGQAIAVPFEDERVMSLDPLTFKNSVQQNMAVEADWHEIPSLKSLISEDYDLAKETIKEMIPNIMQKGTFVAIKEAFKKIMPAQYTALKELKEIVTDRDSTKYLSWIIIFLMK